MWIEAAVLITAAGSLIAIERNSVKWTMIGWALFSAAIVAHLIYRVLAHP